MTMTVYVASTVCPPVPCRHRIMEKFYAKRFSFVNERELIMIEFCLLNVSRPYKITFEPLAGLVVVSVDKELLTVETLENFLRTLPVSKAYVTKNISQIVTLNGFVPFLDKPLVIFRKYSLFNSVLQLLQRYACGFTLFRVVIKRVHVTEM